MYIATNVKVLKRDLTEYVYEVSFGGGPITDEMIRLHGLLVNYAHNELSLIKEIEEVQSFLRCAGFGLSNCILLEVGNLGEYDSVTCERLTVLWSV